MSLKMLLFSNGQSERFQPFYHYAKDWLLDFLPKNLPPQPKVVFISWAIWGGHNADQMFNYAQEHWGQFALSLIPLHKQSDYLKTILEADAIIVGGGSIHMLVRDLELNSLMIPLKDKINSGCLYIGTSSGSIITSPTMHTATEPPLIHIPSHKTLNILPFQINCHYYDADKSEFHNGPTPETRIKNYLLLNPDPRPVVCLRDGGYLFINNKNILCCGTKSTTVFNRKTIRFDYQPGQSISPLLNQRSAFYKTK